MVSARPKIAVTIIGLYAALAASGLAHGFLLPAAAKKAQRLVPPSPPAPAIVRVLYSSTQIVEISSSPGDYNETLNLDNVATMRQAEEATHDIIGMALLIDSPSVTIDKPKGNTGSSLGKKYVFSRLGVSAHTIDVGSRHFRVSLQAIRDKSKGKQRLLVYTFGISEQP